LKKRISLFTKISTLTIVLVIIITIVLSIVLIEINKHSLSLTIKDYYFAVIDDIANTVTTHYQSILNDLSKFTTILNNDNIEVIEKINLISLEISHSELMDYVMVFETNGKLLDIFMPKDYKLPFSQRTEIPVDIIDHLQNYPMHITSPQRIDDSSNFYSLVTIPWINKNETIGYISTYYDLGDLVQIVGNTSLKRFNNDNHIYILNSDGQAINIPDVVFPR